MQKNDEKYISKKLHIVKEYGFMIGSVEKDIVHYTMEWFGKKINNVKQLFFWKFSESDIFCMSAILRGKPRVLNRKNENLEKYIKGMGFNSV